MLGSNSSIVVDQLNNRMWIEPCELVKLHVNHVIMWNKFKYSFGIQLFTALAIRVLSAYSFTSVVIIVIVIR